MTVLATELYVVALTMSIVIVRALADNTQACAKKEDIGHLVQSLQTCANAITGLQPSSEIKKECSPDSLLQTIDNIEQKIATVEDKIGTLEDNIATVEDDVATVEDDVATVEDDVATLEQNVTIMNEFKEIFTQELEEKIITVERKVATLEESIIASMKENVSALQENIATVESEIIALQEDFITLQERIVTIEENMTAAEKKMATIEKAVASNEAMIIDNANNISALNGMDIILCGSKGWTRVAYLNMSLPSQECPSEFRLYNENGVRACGRQSSSGASCDSISFFTNFNGKSYSEVCGRVIGYQYGTPDALHPYGGHTQINSPYIDGVSITHGSPRQHIWTLMAGYRETGTSSSYCPCNTGSTASVPSFISNDYYCESGTSTTPIASTLYADDPLWDGKECNGGEVSCCDAIDIPWFKKVLDSATTDDIELRICGDQYTGEDTPITLYEIYVK